MYINNILLLVSGKFVFSILISEIRIENKKQSKAIIVQVSNITNNNKRTYHMANFTYDKDGGNNGPV